VIISTGLPFSSMRNFSITAVPPEVNSRSSVALFMFVLSVSQWPTRTFSFSNASAPPPGRAGVVTGRIATLSTSAKRRPLENQWSARNCSRFAFPAETLRRESHDRAEKHARNHDVPEQSHSRTQDYQKTQHR